MKLEKFLNEDVKIDNWKYMSNLLQKNIRQFTMANEIDQRMFADLVDLIYKEAYELGKGYDDTGYSSRSNNAKEIKKWQDKLSHY